ncbi:unnamed protein product [Caenorhabditis auriculariae]|uniref:Uncharacterized protein n=1 Tax=Caenorhabditis auriculariae TaxID=2777116 RepID=A0A8S1HQY8_9PELO|nr:unnamed protein product [Caenorhabditis auriculariae]
MAWPNSTLANNEVQARVSPGQTTISGNYHKIIEKKIKLWAERVLMRAAVVMAERFETVGFGPAEAKTARRQQGGKKPPARLLLPLEKRRKWAAERPLILSRQHLGKQFRPSGHSELCH